MSKKKKKSGWDSLTPSEQADWKKNNFSKSPTVSQKQIDVLNSRGTPQANFDYYKKNGANAEEIESLNRFYGKDKTAAAGIKLNTPTAPPSAAPNDGGSAGGGSGGGGGGSTPPSGGLPGFGGRFNPGPVKRGPGPQKELPWSSGREGASPKAPATFSRFPQGNALGTVPGIHPAPSQPMPSRFPMGSSMGTVPGIHPAPSQPMPSRFPMGSSMGTIPGIHPAPSQPMPSRFPMGSSMGTVSGGAGGAAIPGSQSQTHFTGPQWGGGLHVPWSSGREGASPKAKPNIVQA